MANYYQAIRALFLIGFLSVGQAKATELILRFYNGESVESVRAVKISGTDKKAVLEFTPSIAVRASGPKQKFTSITVTNPEEIKFLKVLLEAGKGDVVLVPGKPAAWAKLKDLSADVFVPKSGQIALENVSATFEPFSGNTFEVQLSEMNEGQVFNVAREPAILPVKVEIVVENKSIVEKTIPIFEPDSSWTPPPIITSEGNISKPVQNDPEPLVETKVIEKIPTSYGPLVIQPSGTGETYALQKGDWKDHDAAAVQALANACQKE